MARQFTKASSHYLINSNAPVTAAPFTINYWVYPDNATLERGLLGLGNSGSNQGWHPNLLNATNVHRCWINDGGFTSFTANAMTSSAWNMGTLATASSTSRYLYTNAVQGTQNTTSRTPTVNQFGIGGRIRASQDQFFDGRVAEVAIWNVELTQAEISTLYNSGTMGLPAWAVRPDALVSYWPLLNDDGDIDWAHSGTYDLTATNSPTHADHPPISMWLPMAATLIPAQTGGPKAITGSLAVTSTLTGNVTRNRAITGAIIVTNTLAGDVTTATKPITGAITATSALAGNVTRDRAIDGVVTVTSTLAGNVTSTSGIAILGKLICTSALAGDVTRSRAVSGSLGVSSEMNGDLLRDIGISGEITVTSTLAGSVTGGVVTAVLSRRYYELPPKTRYLLV